MHNDLSLDNGIRGRTSAAGRSPTWGEDVIGFWNLGAHTLLQAFTMQPPPAGQDTSVREFP